LLRFNAIAMLKAMHESALIRLESQMQTRQWDSLPVEQLGELLNQAQAIHRDLPIAGKSRAEIVIGRIRDLIQAKETECRHRELQERLTSIHLVLDRSEKLATRFEQQVDRGLAAAGRFEQQMEKVLGVAERQKFLAEKLDRQTTHLILLTYAVVALTVALFVVTFKEMANAHSAAAEQRQKQ
jgi:hypothetical protein